MIIWPILITVTTDLCLKSLLHSRLLCIHVDCMLVVEQTHRIVIYVGEFHSSSVFGVTQLQWWLQKNKKKQQD